MRTRLLPLLTAVALFIVAGCGDDGDDVNARGNDRDGGSDSQAQPSRADDPLDGKSFFVTVALEGGANRPLVTGTQIRLEFADGRVSADAGCNHLSGAYKVEDETLTVSDLGGTEMGCDQDRMEQDQWLSEILGRGAAIRVDGEQVILTAGDTELTLTGEETVIPDIPLVGTEWTLDSLVEGTDAEGTVSSVPDGVLATVTFDDGGRYKLLAGCNTGGGTYTMAATSATSGTLMLGPAALTRMACDEAAMTVEAAVVAMMQGEVTYVIDDPSLGLRKGDKGLGFSAS